MKRVVYFFGAGASCALSHDGKQVPAMDGMLKKMANDFGADWASFNEILAEIRARDPNVWIYPASNGDLMFQESMVKQVPLNIESLLQLLEEACALADADIATRAEKAFIKLVDLNCRLWAKCDEDIVRNMPAGNNVYRLFADKLKGHCGSHWSHTIISFNYDVWLEQALQESGIWNPDDGYSLPAGVQFRGPNSLIKGADHPNKRSWVYVLKPHGSINWFVPQDDIGGALVIRLDKEGVEDERLAGKPAYLSSAVVDYQEVIGEKVYRPLILPPAQNKGVTGKYMGEVYRRMGKAIREADAFVVVGWSMPETDLFMRMRIFDERNKGNDAGGAGRLPKQLLVCDKNPTSVFYYRYSMVLGSEATPKWHKTGFDKSFLSAMEQVWGGI